MQGRLQLVRPTIGGVNEAINALTRLPLAAFPPWVKTLTARESSMAYERYRVSIMRHQWQIEHDKF